MKVAVIGATGAVGRAMVQCLEGVAGGFEVGLFASPRSAGENIPFKGQMKKVQVFSIDALKGYDYALLSVSGDFSKAQVPALAEIGVTCIDNSSAFRSDPSLPLVVPTVNGDVLREGGGKQRIIANPNCSTIQLVASLKPLKDEFGLREVVVSTYQSTSGAGAKGVEDLIQTARSALAFQPAEPKHFPVSPAFNLIPGIGDLNPESHYCVEEIKVVNETRRLLRMEHLEVLPTTIRVPTFSCHCESVTVRLGEEVTREQVIEAWGGQDDLVWNGSLDYRELPTPQQVAGKEEVFLARLRLPVGKSRADRIQYWCVADNVLKGAATNAVQIMKLLMEIRG